MKRKRLKAYVFEKCKTRFALPITSLTGNDPVMLHPVKSPAKPWFKRPNATVRSNLALIKARNQRIGTNAKINWQPVFEVVLVAAVLVICCFTLIDRPVAMNRGQLPDNIVSVSAFLTRFGKSDWILLPSLLALTGLLFLNTAALTQMALFRLYRWNLWLSFIAAGVGLPSLAVTILKRIIGRPRPLKLEGFGLYDFQPFNTDAAFAAFPSGHSTTIGAFAVVMAVLLPKYRAFFAAFAVLVGFSRVGVGAHHPSDVIAGLAFGAIGAFLVAKWFATRGILFLSTTHFWPRLRPSMQMVPKYNPRI